MCDSPAPQYDDPLDEEYRAAASEVQDLAAVLLRAIRRRDDLGRLVELGRRGRLLP